MEGELGLQQSKETLPIISFSKAILLNPNTVKEVKLPLLKNASTSDALSNQQNESSQKTLKMILEEQIAIDFIESDDDFEQKISENRKIIKLQKMKKPTQKNKIKSKYDNKMREYLQTQNKYLSKKKQQVKKEQRKEQKRDQLKKKEVKKPSSRNKYDQVQQSNSRRLSMRSNQQIDFRRNSLTKLQSDRNKFSTNKLPSVATQSNETLFDTIQSYLQNPRPKYQQLTKPRLSKEQIEEKLKKYSDQLQVSQLHCTQLKDAARATVSDWKKIEVSNKGIFQQQSSFDREIQRINTFMQRNQASLSKHLQNQKMLLEIKFINRIKVDK